MLLSTEQKCRLGFRNFSEHTRTQNFTSAPELKPVLLKCKSLLFFFPSNQRADIGCVSTTIKNTTYKSAIRAVCFMSSKLSIHNAAQWTACPGMPAEHEISMATDCDMLKVCWKLFLHVCDMAMGELNLWGNFGVAVNK